MRRPEVVVWLVAMAVVVSGCTSAAPIDGVADDERVVDVFTNYRGRDADAFRAVLDAFTDQTGIAARHVGTAALAVRLPQRVRDGAPPDVALIPQPALLAELAREGLTVPLDDAVDDLTSTMRPGVADIGVVDGVRHGVWFKVAVKSLLWSPTTDAEGAPVDVPGTLGALLATTERLAAEDATPWCLGMESFDATGWVGTDWVEDLVLRLHGPDVYDGWVEGRIPFTDPRIEEAFATFGEIALTNGSVLGGRRALLSTPALEAIDPMLDDPPGCILSRQASFQEAELPPDIAIGPDGDLVVTVLPAAGSGPPPIVAAGELAAAFNDDPATLELVRYLAGPEAGAVWASTAGGFTSPHTTLDPEDYVTPLDRRLARLVAETDVLRFDGSDQMPTAVGTGTFWAGIVDYASGVPLPDVLEGIQAGYDPE